MDKSKVSFTIDGMACQAKQGATILEVARDNGIEIPTLCYNEALGPEGRCRLCMVEIKRGNRTRLVTSCLYPAEEGLQVQTQTDKVLLTRKMVLELLLARVPDSMVIRDLATKFGVEKARFKPDEGNWKCILCGLCVKTCEEAVGVSAIGLAYRGSDKKVGTPYAEPTGVCIGCGACHFICPTGAIQMTEKEGMRSIWGRDFKLAACNVCGNYFAPEYQLEWMAKTTGVALDFLKTCQDCRK
jgi:NADH dehydrogenase/NADH:ubiquinone oxidoreductase subunit G